LRNAFKSLVGKPEGKRQLEIPTRGWDNITKELMEMGWEAVDWFHLLKIWTSSGPY
jgi:hypothetical protein